MSRPAPSLYGAIRSVAAERGTRPAIVDTTGERVGYGGFIHLADRIAAGLAQRGVTAGSTVAFVLRNSVGYVAAIVACARLGASYVPLLSNFGPADVRTALDRARPMLIVVDGHRAVDGTGLAVTTLAQLAAAEPAPAPPGGGTGVFRQLWSSGSTGFPKMISWRQDTFVTERRRWLADTGITVGDVFFCRHTLDVAHATDLHAFAALLSGATLVLTDPATPASTLLDQLVQHRATVMSALPVHYAELVAACPGGVDLSRLRRPLCGGAYLDPGLIRRAAAALGVRIRQIYGSTEFGLALGDMADPPHADGRMRQVAGVRARLSPLAGRADTGELVLASGCTSEGYVDNPTANARTFRGTEFWTGDVARRGADGTYRILGRLTEALATPAGPVMAPALDEELAGTGVLSAAVCLPAHPGGYRDQVLVAVCPAPGHTEAEAVTVAERTLAAHGLSAAIRCFDGIPRTPVGKVDKPLVRARFETVGAAR